MITVKYKPNRFKNDNLKIKKLPYSRILSVKDYIDNTKWEEIENIDDFDVIVSGQLEENLDKLLLANSQEEIIITPKLSAPVVAVVSAVGSIVGSVLGGIGSAATLGFVGATTVAAKVIGGAVVASTLASARRAQRTINMPTLSALDPINLPAVPAFNNNSSLGNMNLGSLELSSPTYGWDGMRTIQEINSPVPIIYGEHKVAGNIINQYISQNGDKSYLNILIALCEGEIESITDIKINKQPIANFTGVKVNTRLGSNDQEVIPNFEDLHNVKNKNFVLAPKASVIYTTEDSDVEAFEVNFQMPGLFRQNPRSGAIETRSISITVGYRVTGSGSYTNTTFTIRRKQRSVVRFIKRIDGLAPNQYDIRIVNNNSTADQYTQDELIVKALDEIKDVPIQYNNTALLALQLLANEQLSGATPNVSCIVKGLKIDIPQVKNGEDDVAWEDYYWNEDNQEYRLLADDTILSWDGESFIKAYAANPIWCLQDLLLNRRYGLGDFINSSDIDIAIYEEMSKYCEEKLPDGLGNQEKRFRLDVVIDSFTRALDLFVQLTNNFRAYTFYSNGTIIFKIDKEELSSQVFGMGNILANTFSQSWKSKKNTYNIVEVTFLDSAKDYKQETVQVRNDFEIDTQNANRLIKKIRVFTTKLSYALREARHILNHYQYIKRSISFETGFDSLACQPTDKIEVSHDVPQWGFSGRVLEKIIIINGVNDKIDWEENSVNYTAQLRSGRYTPINLAAEVQYQMRKQADDNLTVSWAASKITIANPTLTTFSLLWDTGINSNKNCGDELGYDISADDTGALSYLADNNISEANTTTEIKLDREVVIEGSKTYKVLVKFAGTDILEDKTVSTPPGTWTKLQFSGDPFSVIPAGYDNYSFGVSGIVTKPYRIMSISKTSKGTAAIAAIEYNASVIDDSAVTIPTDNYSALTFNIPNVFDLQVTESLHRKLDGTIINVIDVWFAKPIITDYQFKKYAKAKIYYKEENATSYIVAGETSEEYFAIANGINELTTYEIKVVSIDSEGAENSILISPGKKIYILGKTKPPDDVTGFVAVQDGNSVLFSWSNIADVDLFGYEIREKYLDWDNSAIIATAILGTDYRLPAPAFGTKTYLIKAIDTSRNYSNNAAVSTVTVDNTPDIEGLQDDDLDIWEEGTLEIGSEIVNVVDSLGNQVIDSLGNEVVTNIIGFEIKNNIENFPVVTSLGDQIVNSENIPIYQEVILPDFLELRNLTDGEYADEGIYTSKIIDLGQIYRGRINIIYNIEGADTYYKIEIRTSNNGIDYTAWSIWGFGEYVGRYYQIRFTLGTNDKTKVARLKYLKARATVQYYSEQFEDIVYSGSGTNTQVLNLVYYKKFAVDIQEHGNYYAEITSKNFVAGGSSSIVYRLKDNTTHNLISGSVDIMVRGY